MSFAFGHLIGAWILGKTIEHFSKNKISHLGWFFLLIGGILPDIDFLLDLLGTSELHRTFTHSLIFLIFAPLIIYGVLTLLKHKEKNTLPLLLGSGILVHLVLDMFYFPGVPLFWPDLHHFMYTQILLIDPAVTGLLHGTRDELSHSLKLAVVDMGFGTLWIFYLWFRKKIKF